MFFLIWSKWNKWLCKNHSSAWLFLDLVDETILSRLYSFLSASFKWYVSLSGPSFGLNIAVMFYRWRSLWGLLHLKTRTFRDIHGKKIKCKKVSLNFRLNVQNLVWVIILFIHTLWGKHLFSKSCFIVFSEQTQSFC